jgi:outer membrane lipoprotein carrier protein
MHTKQLMAVAALLSLAATGFGPAHADALERLKSFMRDSTTARAGFTQTVLDKNGKPREESSGTMQLSRPGRFRWEYAKPYRQVIVGDGQKLWLWDADLNQVTVKDLQEALGSSPAALLAGDNDIEKSFVLRDLGSKDGLDWLEATPKSTEGTIDRVRMGFGSRGLSAMELRDSFGQTTLIKFSQLERNPKLSAEQFRFTPPPGADVVGQ